MSYFKRNCIKCKHYSWCPERSRDLICTDFEEKEEAWPKKNDLKTESRNS